jgi:hypothetical protein
MARTALTKIVANGSYPTAGVTVTWTASDVTNGNSIPMTGDDLLLVRGSGGAGTFTITSVANALGRSGTITTEAITDGGYKVLGPFKQKAGWVQSDGALYFAGSAVEVQFAVIKLPRP